MRQHEIYNQTLYLPNLWCFHLRKNAGLVAAVYKPPVVPCLVHSQSVVQFFLSQVRVKVRSHTMDCSWIRQEPPHPTTLFFPDGFYEICCSTLFSAAPLSSAAALMFGHHLCLFWLSLGAWWSSQGFGRWQKGMFPSHVSTRWPIGTRCGRENVPRQGFW